MVNSVSKHLQCFESARVSIGDQTGDPLRRVVTVFLRRLNESSLPALARPRERYQVETATRRHTVHTNDRLTSWSLSRVFGFLTLIGFCFIFMSMPMTSARGIKQSDSPHVHLCVCETIFHIYIS